MTEACRSIAQAGVWVNALAFGRHGESRLVREKVVVPSRHRGSKRPWAKLPQMASRRNVEEFAGLVLFSEDDATR